MGRIFLLITVLLCTGLCWAKISYDGYCLFNVTVENDEQLAYLRSLQSQRGGSLKVRFFHSPMPNRNVDILVSPESVDLFKQDMQSRRITYDIRSDNFQKAIDDEQQESSKYSRLMTFKDSSSPTTLVTSKYLRMSEIESYLNGLVRDYPNLVQLENIGTTYENRALTVVKVGIKNGTMRKPAIWVDSGIHSREWIAPAVGLYILNKLVTNYNRNSTFRAYVENMNWYFLPVMNPDGYEYTHTQDRMWRKNRRRSASSRCTAAWFDDTCCEGVDLNRNFAYNWGGNGASADPCDEIYRGPSAFSEPESKAVRDFLLRRNDVKAFFTMHSYSQMWFYPYGDKKRSYPPDKDELATLAKKATAALKSMYGTSFKVGTAADILYESSGGSDDWAKGVANVKYVYGLELRPSDDDSRYGFILPASYIVPSGEETWAAVRVVADEVDRKFSSSPSSSGIGIDIDQSISIERYTTSNPILGNGQRPATAGCNNKSSSCWWFQSANYCHLASVQELCPRACRLC